MKNFSEQWKALEDKKGDDEPEVPKIPIINWADAFMDYLHRVVGARKVNLAYVVRPEAAVPTIGAQAAHTAFYRTWIYRNGINRTSLACASVVPRGQLVAVLQD
jgi:hypothetical protein